MEPTFIIFVETTDGEIIRAFTWTRGEEEGLRRARADAKMFGVDIVRAWAEPVKVGARA
ncbi:MAG: hypothetical protein WCY93_07855 [Anaerolineaceae bacterium]